MGEADGLAAALLRLDEITRRLRRECPWDREQDERSIVPHTVEEAYELADAAHSGDDAKLLDELGDVLFQVYFLALLLEERGEGSLGKMMTDDELYRSLNQAVNNLNEATLSLNRLVDDIQKNPKKYINLKVF